MKKLFLDVETTGLARTDNWRNYGQFPRIVSVAWIFEGKENYHIIKPDGYKILGTNIHGITQEQAEKEGKSIVILQNLIKDGLKADKIIGHNVYFDTAMIKANILRYGLDIEACIKALHKSKRYCTMIRNIKYVGAKRGKNLKYPTLQELHEKIFGYKFKNSHNALEDVKATKRCYDKLNNI